MERKAGLPSSNKSFFLRAESEMVVIDICFSIEALPEPLEVPPFTNTVSAIGSKTDISTLFAPLD